ncbi:cytochrome c oxidase subunit NDUFA4-like [Haliotis asinina]|uniref:cytochrome c oxidase subunit NDUFA4-like n=1 Tax=Haliotis asinina TaxID=109174 RepID=UPI003531AD14
MKGLTVSSLKSHPSLIPLFVATGVGAAAAFFYTMRLATRNPDVCWDRKNNPYPWQQYERRQYKFYSPIRDYSKETYPKERPSLD